MVSRGLNIGVDVWEVILRFVGALVLTVLGALKYWFFKSERYAWMARSDVGVREDPVRSFPDSPDNLPLTIALALDVWQSYSRIH